MTEKMLMLTREREVNILSCNSVLIHFVVSCAVDQNSFKILF